MLLEQEFLNAKKHVKKGDLVKRGQIIGSVAPGKNFLHFEMIKDNQRVDPIQFFEQ